MKKLRLNNIFHWLYAILMFLPFLSTLLSVLVNWGSGNAGFSPDDIAFSMVSSGIGAGADGGTIGATIENVFSYVFIDLFGFSDAEHVLNVIGGLFTYWVVLSVGYLCFDVLMFLINLAHRWIDRGTDL